MNKPTPALDGSYTLRRLVRGVWLWRASSYFGAAEIGGIAFGKERAKRAAEQAITKRRPTQVGQG